MGKLIFFLLIIGMIYMLFKKKSVPTTNKESSNPDSSDDLIQCDRCKTFYPQNEIKRIDGKNICKDCYANS